MNSICRRTLVPFHRNLDLGGHPNTFYKTYAVPFTLDDFGAGGDMATLRDVWHASGGVL